MMRPLPDPVVIGWFSRQTQENLFLSAVFEAELRTGVLLMPVGKRRDGIAQVVETMLHRFFDGNVLAFDQACTQPYAEITAYRRSNGKTVSVQDTLIAAIAKAHKIPLATRNVREFEDTGVTIIDSWTVH